MYQLTNDSNVVINLDADGWITVDSGVRDADEYAARLAAGNTPEPAPTDPT